jgi:hypothetical protein
MDGNVLTVDDTVLYTSRWNGTEWSQPTHLFHAPGARSELALSAGQGGAAVAVVSAVPGESGSAVMVSLKSAGTWGAPIVMARGEAGLDLVGVVLTDPGRALVIWTQSGMNMLEGDGAGKDGEVREDGVEWIVSASVSAGGVTDAPVVVSGAEDVVDLEAVLGAGGLPVAAWATVADASKSRMHIFSRGAGGWSAAAEAALVDSVIDDLEIVSGDTGGEAFAAYLEAIDGGANLGFAVLSSR